MEHSTLPIRDIFEKTYEKVDDKLSELTMADGGDRSGCTAVTVFLRIEDEDGKQPFLHGPDSDTTRTTTQPPVPSISDLNIDDGGKDSHSLNESQEVPESPSLSSSSGHSPATNVPTASEIFTPTDPNLRRVLYCANAGDSRAVLCRGGKAIRLSQDHRPSNEEEKERVLNAGGAVLLQRVYIYDHIENFGVTRSLGDSRFKNLLIGSPYTTRTELTDEDEFLILASDGVSSAQTCNARPQRG